MITLSLSTALKIQEQQAAVFARHLDEASKEHFLRRVREESKIPEGRDLDEKLPYSDVHAVVPCGIHLEKILREISDVELIPPD